MYKQGDIIVVKFPFTDGSEFVKRPALIISNDTVIKNNDCLHQLQLESYIRVHKIFTLNKSLIISKITEAKPIFFQAVRTKICSLLK